jgi:hypothetical protein
MTIEYGFHPISEIFPLMGDKEFAELRDDIHVNGQRDPVTLLKGQILDGRNRYLACKDLGIDARIVEWDGVGSPLAFVISHNLRRRHLSESQRAMVASKLSTIERVGRPIGRTGEIAPIGANISQGEAADMLNVSRQSVSRAAKVQKEGVTELVQKIETGELTVGAAAEFVSKHPSKIKQARILKKTRVGNGNKVVHIASHLKVEKTLKKARTTLDVCLKCNPSLPATEENFVADLTATIAALKKRAGGSRYSRYLDSVLEEISELNIADETLSITEQILGAIRTGLRTDAEIIRFTRVSKEDFEFAMNNLQEHGSVRSVPQGGKTEVARGRRKMLWEIVEKKAARTHHSDEDDDDDDEEFGSSSGGGRGPGSARELRYEPVEVAA